MKVGTVKRHSRRAKQSTAQGVHCRKSGDKRIDFHTELQADARVELISWEDPEAADLSAQPLTRVGPSRPASFSRSEVLLGPAIEDGFYYDFDVEEPLHAGRPV